MKSTSALGEPMTFSALFHTAIKIFGLYFVILTITNIRDIILSIGGQVFLSNSDGMLPLLFYQIYYVVFNTTVALILIFRTSWVAEKLQLVEREPLNMPADKTDWIELAMIVIGALAVLHAFPEVLFKLVHYTFFNDYEPHERSYFWTNTNKAEIFFSIFKFVIGLFLLVNARNFARRLKKCVARSLVGRRVLEVFIALNRLSVDCQHPISFLETITFGQRRWIHAILVDFVSAYELLVLE